MLELLLAGGVIWGMYKIADADDQSVWLWTSVTVLACVLAIMFVPIPFGRVLIAGAVAFVAMFVTKFVRDR